jgi:cyclophilin family peptidyl-prolyl cis-trans isomerase
MRNGLFVFLALVMVLGIGGCRSKKELELYAPGDTEVWQTVDREERARQAANNPMVELVTNRGRIVLELFEEEAPRSVENFLEYAEDGFYEDTLFHRVEEGLVIQGGGFTEDMERKETRAPIPNEAGNGLRNLRGTVGMARTQAMNSATSQFYINLVDNAAFNGDGETGGYAVFGRVYEGMDVVDAIAMVETGTEGGMRNVPLAPVVIEEVRVLD